MTREEAQRQLTALAQVIRAGKAVTTEEYPVLRERTERGVLLWQLTEARIASQNWSEARIADWYAHEAIDVLRLEDE